MTESAIQNNRHKLLWRFVYILCILFLLFFIFLHFNNRINNTDEFIFLSRMEEMGFWNSLTTWEYNQRPVSYFLFNATFYWNEKIATLKWTLLLANLCFMAMYIHSFKVILTRLVSYTNVELEVKKTWALSILLVMCSFFFCFERSEIWFWYLCTIIYLLPFVFLNYGIFFLFEPGKIKWLSAIFFFLIGGSLELLIPMTGFLLVLLVIQRKITWLSFFINGISLSLFSVFQLLNEGVTNRLQLEAGNYYNNTFVSVFSHLGDSKNLFFVLLLIVLLCLFQEMKAVLMKINWKKLLTQSAIFLIVCFLVTWLIAAIVFSGSFGVLRMWSPFSLFLMLFIVLVTACLSLRISKQLNIAGVLSASLFLLLFGYFSYNQLQLTHIYAKEYDTIVQEGRNKTLKPIDSGVLVSPGNMNVLENNLTLYNHEK
jgi:hypothetical protein